MTKEQREDLARERALRYAQTALSDLLNEAADRCDCKCRHPDGNGPPCGRESLATELRARAASQARLEEQEGEGQ